MRSLRQVHLFLEEFCFIAETLVAKCRCNATLGTDMQHFCQVVKCVDPLQCIYFDRFLFVSPPVREQVPVKWAAFPYKQGSSIFPSLNS